MASPVKQAAEAAGIPVYQPATLSSAEVQEELKALAPDLMIVAAYGLILPPEVLEIPRLGCINIHASLLPRWRGAAPIQRAIQAGDQVSGITIMQMDSGLDTGNMLLKRESPIQESDTGGSLHDRLSLLGAQAIIDYLAQPNHYLQQSEQQDDSLANYAHKLNKQEAELDWRQNADQLARTIRAFNPWPVAYLSTQNQRVRVFEASVEANPANHPPGYVIRKSKAGILIATASGALNIMRLQLPGGKAMMADAFVNGGKAMLDIGTQLSWEAVNE